MLNYIVYYDSYELATIFNTTMFIIIQ